MVLSLAAFWCRCPRRLIVIVIGILLSASAISRRCYIIHGISGVPPCVCLHSLQHLAIVVVIVVSVEFTICVGHNLYGLTKTEMCINTLLNSLLDR